jgi:RNA-binding protein Musashi
LLLILPRDDLCTTLPEILSQHLQVLGIPWDIDTEGLRQYMSKYGDLDDIIVMKDRATGRSRGFGYVTFRTSEDAEKAVATQHSLNGRMLEVKIATPKEDMKPPTKKITRVFVARIPPSVTDEMFRSYFEKYGILIDAYMPKDQITKAHRGIGFVTYEHADSVDKLMAESHELAGSTIAVDRATPKEETAKPWGKPFQNPYGAYGVYTNAAARFGAFGGALFPGYAPLATACLPR